MTVQEFIQQTNSSLTWENTNRPFVKCGDGLVVSIQASYYHYCIPKGLPYSVEPEYENLEVGFQDHRKVPEWDEKYERQDWGNPDPAAINCLYGFVSIQDLDEFLKNHGGIASIEWEDVSL